jgi:hypothetical protein
VQVYSVDWSTDGGKVASGSKDHLLKMRVLASTAALSGEMLTRGVM